MDFFFSVLIVAATCFLLGSVPFGLFFAQAFCGIDPRLDGSRNVGATNVARLCGMHWGVLTLLCDLLKGFLPVLLFVRSDNGFLNELAYPAALAVILGHMFSFFLGGKGGKGVATTIGAFLALAPLQLIIAAVACVLVIWRTTYVSAGSLTLMTVLPLLFLLAGRWCDLAVALIVAVLVFAAHRQNIVRLMRGVEKPLFRRPEKYV